MNATYVTKLQNRKVLTATQQPADLKQTLLNEKARAALKAELMDMIDEADDQLIDTPESYRNATLAIGVKDPLVYSELAGIYEEDGRVKDLYNLLAEALAERNGFAPDMLLRIGQFYQKEQQPAQALEVLERAVVQLQQLGFREEVGDYSTDDLKQLRAQIKELKSSDNNGKKK
jgi:tetratricopeptide (TPR) repeat protein